VNLKFYVIACIVFLSGCAEYSLTGCRTYDNIGKNLSAADNSCKQQKSIKIAPPALKVRKNVAPKKESVTEIKLIDQIISHYTKGINRGFISTQEAYEKRYFKPWRLKGLDISKEDAMWAHTTFNAQNSYGENLLPREKSFFDEMLENANFDAFSTLNQRAISLRELNVRAFPTKRPLLRDPKSVGEGFPFDYLQNTTVAPNKPLLISHYSKDRAWVFVESSFAYGWVESRNIAIIEKKYTDIWQEAQQLFFIKENEPIFTTENDFLFKSKVGLMLPIIQEQKGSFKILTISNYKHSKAYYIQSVVSKDIVHKGIMEFNAKNIETILSEVSKVNYGWGGIYGQRDCSSLLRDFFAPFGVWLPRNSSQQAKVGKVISLEGLSDDEKLAAIKKEALPFETLLYKKGHIVLYVGTFNGKVVVFHNTWGVKTKHDGVEGRYLIGKPIFSTLELGEELDDFDSESSLLKEIESMNILTL